MRKIYKVGWFLAVLLALLFFILLTDPYTMPLALVTAPFLLLSSVIYQSAKAAFAHAPIPGRKGKFMAAITTALLLLLILLQSIQQLSLKDFLILGALLGGLIVYLRRLDL